MPESSEPTAGPAIVLAMISVGGVLGALGRHGISVAWPHPPGGFAWSTWTVNVSGCLLIGMLMTLVAHHRPGRLVRPFFGVGLLGGYTTFSASVVDVQQAAAHGAPGVALLYLGATVAGTLLAVWLGTAAAETALAGRS